MQLPPASVSELSDVMERGERVKFLFFWGHQPQPDGKVGKGSLSQWWPAPFMVDELAFATAEHYMMWRKAMLFGDSPVAAQILTVGHPSEAKALGRQVSGFDDATWNAHRFEIVTAASAAKFSQHPDLRGFLLATGDRVLVEASPRDRVWGIGLGASHEYAEDPRQWRGLNLLGFALMRARATLRGDA
jgi:ribA/ribD-fused uncharacterized protein